MYLDSSASIHVHAGKPVLCTPKLNHDLHLSQAIALSFLSFYGEPNPTSDVLCEVLPDAAAWVDDVIERFWAYLGGNRSRPINLSWLQTVTQNEVSGIPTRRRAAPTSLVWLVTLACNRRCPYCFYDVTSHAATAPDSPGDATFSTQQVMKMLYEMRQIGSSRLYLTGGEPFLRRDLIDIMAEARQQRVRVDISTKFAISRSMARQIARTEPAKFTYSIDSANARQADGLAGSKGFFPQACESIKNLVEAGVAIEVNAVVMRQNIRQLGELAKLLVELRVKELSLSMFIPPVSRSALDSVFSIDGGAAALQAEIDKLTQRWGDQLTIRFGDSAANAQGNTPGRAVCEVGFSELHVLPDGRATRCRYLPNATHLELESLETHTILEVWNGESLSRLNSPHAESFAGSGCDGCSSQGACNSRGRCFVSALAKSNTLFGPDDFCAPKSIVQ